MNYETAKKLCRNTAAIVRRERWLVVNTATGEPLQTDRTRVEGLRVATLQDPRIAEWRRKGAEGTLTLDEEREALAIVRAGRMTAAPKPKVKKLKKPLKRMIKCFQTTGHSFDLSAGGACTSCLWHPKTHQPCPTVESSSPLSTSTVAPGPSISGVEPTVTEATSPTAAPTEPTSAA